jgi:hypothetical protein
MLYVKLNNVHPLLDGEYPLDGTTFTNRELRTIKQMSGVRALELSEAFTAGDNDLFVAFAAIALARAGKPYSEDALWEADGGKITFEEKQDADASPPDDATSHVNEDAKQSSGESSSTNGEHSQATSMHEVSGTPV